MAKQKFVHFVPRPKPKKRPGVHKKSKNKYKKLSKNLKDPKFRKTAKIKDYFYNI